MSYDISCMVGKTLVTFENTGDTLKFTDSERNTYLFHHINNCCESVRIEDICGDLYDLIDAPLLQAEEVSSDGHPDPSPCDSFTWTFYKFATIKGAVTVRWLGESNGYYSESVDFTVKKWFESVPNYHIEGN